MLAPLSWLRDFAPFDDDVAALAGALSSLGLVVEGVERVGEGLGDVIVARVLATRTHPGADRVQLVDVDRGDGETTQIVCGAFNFAVDDLVPLAPIGARLPGDFVIGRRKVRGEWSEGMLCSASELALSQDHEGIMILGGESVVPGMALLEVLGVEPDVVFDLDVTPNRPDALCIVGIARDLAAKVGVPFRRPPVRMAIPMIGSAPGGSTSGGLKVAPPTVRVESGDLCPRFTVTRLSVSVGPAPDWMARRLTLAGMRPINNVVDISNYVMLEMGQPNHPYDVDRLGGAGLVVRRATPGESMATLDEIERRLSEDDCLICDASGSPVGIGGIMGGASSGIGDETTDILLEAAWFDSMTIARTSKRLGLRTEASVRFERGVDPEGIDRAVARYCELAAQVAGASVTGATVDVTGELPPRCKVTVRTARVNAVLGTELTPEEVRGYLDPIGFACVPAVEAPAVDAPAVEAPAVEAPVVEGPAAEGPDGGDFVVTIPSWRPDSEREIDVIEEVARHHGYTNIARRLPPVRQVGGLNAYQRDRRLVREIMVGAGLFEAWSTWFLAPDDLVRAGLPSTAVEVENPLVAEERLLPPSMLPGMLRAVASNAAHRHADVSLFEIGHVFIPPPEGATLPDEPERLAVALAGRDAAAAMVVWRTLAEGLRLDDVQVEAADVAGLHPTRSVRVSVGHDVVGHLGEVDPGVLAAHDIDGRVGWIELDLGLLLAAPRRAAGYRQVSRFPSADLDLAFVVPEAVPAAAVAATLAETAGERCESVELFDVFRGGSLGAGSSGGGVRSLAFHLRFSALDHTLSDEELTELRSGCIAAVDAIHGATLRV